MFWMLSLATLLLGPVEGAPKQEATYTFKTAGNCTIQADVYRPDEKVGRPAIMWIHGGALIFGSRTDIRAGQLERYLDEGFVIISIDYRLAPETKLPAILEDVRDAWSWIRSAGPGLFGIDPDRIAVVGHSAGGYLALTCGYRLDPRPKALVSFYGYGDIVGDWYARPDPFYLRSPLVERREAYASVGSQEVSEVREWEPRWRFYLFLRQNGLWPREVAGLDPSTQAAESAPFCPLRNVDSRWPPTMLLHGDQDTDVPFDQSLQMARELEAQGVRHELVVVNGGKHGFDRHLEDEAVADAFRRVIQFLREAGR